MTFYAGGDCGRICAMLEALGDEEPGEEAVRAILEHFDECATCLDAETELEDLLAAYRVTTGGQEQPPARLAQQLLDKMCGRS
jgi:hypothetical protein